MAAATAKSVQTAMRTLEERGERVSVRSVYRIVGGNYNQVAKYLKEAMQREDERIEAPEEVKALFDDLSDNLYTTITRLVSEDHKAQARVLNDQLKSVETELVEAGESVTELQEELAKAKAAYANVEKELQKAKDERNQAIGALKVREEEIVRLKDDLVRLEATKASEFESMTEAMEAMTHRLEIALKKRSHDNDRTSSAEDPLGK